MCLGIPGKIIEFVDSTNHIAKVDVSGVRRSVNVGLLLPDGLEVGDWVLVHVGFALSKIDEEEADQIYQFLRQLGETYEQELEQIQLSEGKGGRDHP